MSVLISEIDVRLNKLNFLDQNNPKIFTNKPLAQFAVSFKCWFILRKLWMVTYKSLKVKYNPVGQIPKVVAVTFRGSRLRELFVRTVKSQFKQGFTNVVITRADHLWEWSQGAFQPYLYLNFSTL